MAEKASDLGVLNKLTSILPSGQQVLDYVNPVKTFQNYVTDVKGVSEISPVAGVVRAASPFAEAAMTSAAGPLGLAFGALRQLVPYEATSPYGMEGVPVSSIRSAPGGKTHLGADVPGGGYIVDTKDLHKLKFGPLGHQLQYTDASGQTRTLEQGEGGLSENITTTTASINDPYSNLSSAQAGHLLSLRDSDDYSKQQKHAEITSAPPAQQSILAQQSMEQAESASGSPTVICTELHRQGLIPEEWYKVDQKVGQQFWHSDPEVMIGYLSWGVPVAKLMAKSKVVTFLAKGLALKWAQEMYAQECKPELSTSAGRALCKYGPRICKFIGRRMSWQDLKVE